MSSLTTKQEAQEIESQFWQTLDSTLHFSKLQLAAGALELKKLIELCFMRLDNKEIHWHCEMREYEHHVHVNYSLTVSLEQKKSTIFELDANFNTYLPLSTLIDKSFQRKVLDQFLVSLNLNNKIELVGPIDCQELNLEEIVDPRASKRRVLTYQIQGAKTR